MYCRGRGGGQIKCSIRTDVMQFEFMSEHGTRDAIFFVRQLQEGFLTNKYVTCACLSADGF